MRIAESWADYQLIDTSNGEKLEKWKDISLIRPDPQIIWNTCLLYTSDAADE